MRYPTVSHSRCQYLASQLVQGLEPSIDSNIIWVGSDHDVDLMPVRRVAEQIAHEIARADIVDKDRFEGAMAVPLYSAFEELPVEVLDDPGFWAYLSLAIFWDFIAWREDGPFSRGNHMKYVDGQSPTESVLNRMYLRAASVGGKSHADLAGAIAHGTDFWRSHILRVRTGTAPPVARALARSQRDDRLSTNEVREVARRLNRIWTNVALHGYDDREADGLIIEMRSAQSGEDSAGHS